MNGTSTIIANLNSAECIKPVYQFVLTEWHNICTGSVAVTYTGVSTYINFFIMVGMLVGLCLIIRHMIRN